jgi:hypothetical protein
MPESGIEKWLRSVFGVKRISLGLKPAPHLLTRTAIAKLGHLAIASFGPVVLHANPDLGYCWVNRAVPPRHGSGFRDTSVAHDPLVWKQSSQCEFFSMASDWSGLGLNPVSAIFPEWASTWD